MNPERAEMGTSAGVFRRVQLMPGLAVVVLTVLLLWLAGTIADVLLLLFISVLLAVYLSAVTDVIGRRFGLARGWAFVAALTFSLAALVALGVLLVPPVVDQTRQLITKLPDYARAWTSWFNQLVANYPALQPVVDPDKQGQIVDVALNEVKDFAAGVVPKVFNLLHVFIDIASVCVMAIYLTLHPQMYRDLVVGLVPPRHRDRARDVFTALSVTLRAWIIAQLVAMLVLGVLTAFLLYLLSVPYWLAFGIFTGLAAIVPFFGTLVSTILPALFVLGADGSPLRALLVVLVGVLVHLVEGNFIAPLIFQRGVHLPPVLTIMSVLIVGSLLGPVGLLVAVPTLAVVMVLVRKVLFEGVYGDAPHGAKAAQ